MMHAFWTSLKERTMKCVVHSIYKSDLRVIRKKKFFNDS